MNCWMMLACSLWIASAGAEEPPTSNTPYIDRLKKGMEVSKPADTEVAPAESYSVREKRKLEEKKSAPSVPQGEYIEYLKKTDPVGKEGTGSLDTQYTKKEKEKLNAGQSEAGDSSAIQKVKEGRSQIEAKKLGEIHYAAGLRVGARQTRSVTAADGVSKAAFDSVYGTAWTPDLEAFYEYQPFHSEWFGNIGLFLQMGVAYNEGYGSFEYTIPKPDGLSGNFEALSTTKFSFYTLPVTLGVDYRFNLFRVVRPFVMAGATAIGYMETRDDDRAGHQGYSFGYFLSGGVAITMDWMMPGTSWDLYLLQGVHHFYLTLEYARLVTLPSDVNFSVDGFSAGLTYEF